MDKQYIEQGNMQQRYMLGQLSPEESVEFEEYLIEHPELIEDIELEMALRKGLVQGQVASAKKPLDRQNEVGFGGILSWWKPVYSHGVAMAASVALIAVLTLDYRFGGITNSSASPEIYYLENYRGSTPTLSIPFAAKDAYKILVFSLPSNESGLFSLHARGEDDSQFSLSSIESNAQGEFVYVLERNKLDSGKYQLLVAGAHDETVVSRFDIEVVKD